MNEIVKKDEQPVQVTRQVTTPADLLNIAVSNNADMEKLEKLMDLQERWEANEARKAFTSALSAFKSEAIEITKNKTVSFTNNDNSETSYSHATLDHVVEVVTPKLSLHGLSHKWSTNQGEGGRITVTCELTHNMGHSECVSLVASPDDSGKKNNIQRIASTITYLQRYTFLSITGLAAKGVDDDGASAGKREIGQKEALEIEMRGINYGMACYHLKDSIEAIKTAIEDGDLQIAAEAISELSDDEFKSIWRAPTKGGIFTTDERATIKSDDFARLVRELKTQGE